MRRFLTIPILLGLALAVWTVTAAPVRAQDATGAPAPDASGTVKSDPGLVAETRELLAGVEQDMKLLGELRAGADTATGEELALLDQRRNRLGADLLARIDALVKNLVRMESAGLETSELRAAAEPLLRGIDPLAHRRIDELHEGMRQLAAERDAATPGEQADIEAKIAEKNELLNAVLLAALDNIENMDRLGLETAKQREHLATVLVERAETSLSRVVLVRNEIAAMEARLAQSPDDADLKTALDAARTRQQTVTDGLRSTVAMMRRIDLDATVYQQALIRATGQITTDILNTRVAIGLVQQWVASVETGLVEDGPRWLFRAVVIVLILLGFHVLARMLQRAVRRAVSSSKLEFSLLLQNTFVSASGAAVRILGILIALSQLGFSLGPLLAGLGIAGFIVGFALQDTLANFAAGMMILVYRPYDVGDLVEAGGAFGKVSRMSLVSTTILTIDHQTLVVPNGKIWGDVIKNVTAQKVRRVDLEFGIGYGDDIPKTERVLMDILKQHPKVLADPEPMVKLHTLGESSVDFVVRPWVLTDDYWDVYWDVTREVKMRFDREGISIPFPQRDVHVYEERKRSAAGDVPEGRAREDR